MKTEFQTETHRYEPQGIHEVTQPDGRTCLLREWHRFGSTPEWSFAFFPIRATRKQIITWRS